ncbi:MAG: hypothetical protein O2868_19320 [Proteobacteria bacterium]|nr:hypothetical protein [Pseudomonadota bacterium]
MNDSNHDPFLTEKEASRLLGAAPSSIKQSRHTGFLFGHTAPAFMKMGRSARYKLSALLEFRDQFPEYRNTSEFKNEETR